MSDPWPTDLNAWTWRRPITYTPTRTLSAFPNLLVLSAADLDYADFKSDGTDLRLALPDETILKRELDTWNTAGTSVAWFNTGLTATVECKAYIYGGNAAADDMSAADRQATWDANFKMVYHLGDAASPALDSTVNVQSGTQGGGVTFGTAGKVGNACSFDGGDDVINLPSTAFNFASPFTIEVWVNRDVAAQQKEIISNYPAANWLLLETNASNAIRFVQIGQVYSSGTFGAGVWKHVAVSSDHTLPSANMKIFLDGSQDATTANQTTSAGGTSGIAIGSAPGLGRWFDGGIDEVRVSNTPRSTDWLAESYAQQSGDVWAVGEKELKPSGGGAVGAFRRHHSGLVIPGRLIA